MTSVVTLLAKDFVGVDETMAGAVNRGAHRQFEIDDFELMFDERPSCLPVSARALGGPEVDPCSHAQQPCSAIGERVNDRSRAYARIIVELGARPIDVACMK